MPNPVLLMTRPREGAERFVAMLPSEARGRVDICHAPLIEIESLPVSLELEGVKGVIFTSSNAVESVEAHDLPAFCIGEATTKKAAVAGWNARQAGQDADSLVADLCRSQPESPLLHLRGRHTRGNIAERLSQCSLPTQEVIVYNQKLLPLGDEAIRLLKGGRPVIAPVFSPRVARQFVETACFSVNLHLVAMSAAVAEPFKGLAFGSMDVVERPNAEEVAKSVAGLVERLMRVEG